MRLFIFGIDGLDPQRIRLLDLPNINGLPGVHASCFVPVPCTWMCWPTICTGLLPYRHGVLVDTKPAPPLPFLSRLNVRTHTFLWTELNACGLSCGVSGVPVCSWPPDEAIRGWMYSGELAWPQEASSAAVLAELTPLPGGRTAIWDEGVILPEGAGEAEVLSKTETFRLHSFERAQISFDNVLRVIERFPTDVVFHYQHTLDLVQHYLYHESCWVDEFYALFDRFVGEVLARVEPESLVIVSDHGFQAQSEEAFAELGRTTPIRSVVIGGQKRWVEPFPPRGENYTSGTHRRMATFIASGPPWRSVAGAEDMTLEDVMPTILWSLGILPPPALDGRMREDLTGGVSGDEASPVQSRLESLGYADAPPGVR